MLNDKQLNDLNNAVTNCNKNNQLMSDELNNVIKEILPEGKKEIKEDGKVHYSGYMSFEMFDEMMRDPNSVLDL